MEEIPNNKLNKFAISFLGGDFKVREKSDISLWCLDSTCHSCVIILPEPSYKFLDSLVTEYSEKYQVAATIGCIDLDTENPTFMPAMMSIEAHNNFYLPLYEFMKNKLQPSEDLSRLFLDNIKFVYQDNGLQSIKLWRQSNDPRKGDLFTRDKQGNRIEIYVTHLLKTETSYTTKEIFNLKFRHLFKP